MNLQKKKTFVFDTHRRERIFLFFCAQPLLKSSSSSCWLALCFCHFCHWHLMSSPYFFSVSLFINVHTRNSRIVIEKYYFFLKLSLFLLLFFYTCKLMTFLNVVFFYFFFFFSVSYRSLFDINYLLLFSFFACCWFTHDVAEMAEIEWNFPKN